MFKKWIKALLGISFLSIISRILGFLRELLLANKFGISQSTDSYFTSFIFFDLLIALNSAVIVATITSYSETSENLIRKPIKNIFTNFLIIPFFIIFILISALWYFVSNNFEYDFVLFFSSSVFLLSAPLLFISGYFGGIHQYKGNNFIPSLLPVFFNFIGILSLIAFSNKFGILALPSGFLVGIVAYLVFQLIYPVENKNLFSVELLLPQSTKIFLFGIFGIFINNLFPIVVGFVERLISFFLIVGSFSYYSYSTKIFLLPITITSLAISTSILPFLAKSIQINDDRKNFNNLISNAFLILTISAVFLTILLLGFNEQLITLILQHGAFNSENTRVVSSLFYIISFAILPALINPLLTTVYFLFNLKKRLFYNNIIGIVVFVLSQIIFSAIFNDARVLAISFVIYNWIITILNYYYLYENNIQLLNKTFLLKIFVITIISSVIGIILNFLVINLELLNNFSLYNKIYQIILIVLISSLIIIPVLILISLIFNIRLKKLYELFKKPDNI